MLAITLSLIAVFVAMSLLPTAPWVPLALLVAWAIANDVFMPSQQRRLAELAPEARGLVLALNASALYLGMAGGSLLAGAVSVRAGFALPPLVSAGLASASLLASGVTQPRDHIVLMKNEWTHGPRTALRGSGGATILVGRSPFSAEDLDQLERVARAMHFEILVSPRSATDCARLSSSPTSAISNRTLASAWWC